MKTKAEFLDLMSGEPHEIFASENAYMRSDEPDETHPGSGVICIGKSQEISNFLVRFAIRFPKIIIDLNEILAIYLYIYLEAYSNDNILDSIKMQLYETDGAWNENTATWNNMDQFRTTPKFTATIPFANLEVHTRQRIDIDKALIPYLFGNGMLITANEEDIPWGENLYWQALACGHQYCQPEIIIRTK